MYQVTNRVIGSHQLNQGCTICITLFKLIELLPQSNEDIIRAPPARNQAFLAQRLVTK